MSKTQLLKDLASQLAEASSHAGTLKKDIKKTCRSLLNESFAKLDLVTREEFDIQTKVLARTRKKLEELENYVKELETLLREKKHK